MKKQIWLGIGIVLFCLRTLVFAGIDISSGNFNFITDVPAVGSQYMILKATGNVGIGYNFLAPQSRLHLDESTGPLYLKFTNNATLHTATDGAEIGLPANSSDLYISQRENAPIRLQTNKIERLTVLGGGNVGIGATNPYSKLHLADTTNALYIQLTNTATGQTAADGTLLGLAGGASDLIVNQREAAAIRFRTSNLERVTVLANGNVGIDKLVPTERLEVSGNIKAKNIYNSAGLMTGSQWANGAGAISYTGGKVGVGTASPNDAFHVEGVARFRNGANDPAIYLNTRAADNSGVITFTSNAANSTNQLGLVGYGLTSSGSLDMYSNDIITLRTGSTYFNGGTERVRILSDGKVGIGTTAPANLLHVSGANHTRLQLEAGTSAPFSSSVLYKGVNVALGSQIWEAGINIGGNDGNFEFYDRTNSKTPLVIGRNTGLVGIGTTSPTYKLDIWRGDNSGNTVALRLFSDFSGAGAPGSAGVISYEHLGNNLDIKSDRNDAGTISLSTVTGSVAKNRVFVANNGNVGIGTTNPVYRFQTVDNGTIPFGIVTSDFIFSTTGSALRMRMGASVGNTYSAIDATIAGASSWGNLVLQSGGGYVGIGTTSPQELLHLSANVPVLRFQSTNSSGRSYQLFSNSDGKFYLRDVNAGENRLVVDSLGNVGIGTPTPSATLAVRSTNAPATIIAENTALPSDTYISVKGRTNTGVVKTATFGLQNSTGYIGDGGNLISGLFIDYTKVGIGINSPAMRLDLMSDNNARALLLRGRANDNISELHFGKNDGTFDSGGAFRISSRINAGYLSIDCNASEKFIVTAGGNVGIGTNSPSTTLEVVKNAGSSVIRANYNSSVKMDLTASSGAIGFVGTNSAHPVAIQVGGVEQIRVTPSGNVGVGTSDPLAQINGNTSYFRPIPAGRFVTVYSPSSEAVINLRSGQNVNGAHIGGVYFSYDAGQDDAHNQLAAIQAIQYGNGSVYEGADLNFFTKPYGNATLATSPQLIIKSDGNVGIGTKSPSAKLSVNGNMIVAGTITAKEVTVLPTVVADYVFEPSYKLLSLSEVSSFITQNKHLPNVPSEVEIKAAGGINVSEFQMKLLEKIEELTLYVIDLDRQNRELKEQNAKIMKVLGLEKHKIKLD